MPARDRHVAVAYLGAVAAHTVSYVLWVCVGISVRQTFFEASTVIHMAVFDFLYLSDPRGSELCCRHFREFDAAILL